MDVPVPIKGVRMDVFVENVLNSKRKRPGRRRGRCEGLSLQVSPSCRSNRLLSCLRAGVLDKRLPFRPGPSRRYRPDTLGFSQRRNGVTPLRNAPFEYSFLDSSFDQAIQDRKRGWAMLFGGFSVACDSYRRHLVCLVWFLFSVQKRTKEIGVRKAVGASVSGIVLLLSREYVLLVGVANLVAWPIAYLCDDEMAGEFRLPG